jgi:hypothetical protein
MCVFIKLLGLEYDQGLLALVKELLLLGNIFKALLLRTLELCTVYHNTQVQLIRNSTPNNINGAKHCYKATVYIARVA